jgi:asparagine synthase (glutamine-hydrolysing)
MAHSLEVRVPYLDRTVVEFAQRLGAGLKIRARAGKWLHRHVCRQYLPEAMLGRRKRGFAVNVVDQWFTASIRSELSAMLLNPDSLMFELLDPRPIRALLEDHRSGRNDNHKLLFSLVVVEQWLRQVRAIGVEAAHAR